MEQGDESWETLLRLARQGEERAGAQLVERLHPVVIRIVRNHLPHAMDEADLAQEVFLKMFSKLDTYRGDQPLEHWVARITRNTCYDHLRKQKRRGELRCADLSEEEEIILEGRWAEEHVTRRLIDTPGAVRQLLARLLGTLKPAEQRVLRLLDLEEMPVKEIASLLGWGESRVKVTAFRARKKLREVLKDLEPGLKQDENEHGR